MDEAKLPITVEMDVKKLRERATAESGSDFRIFEPGSPEYVLGMIQFACAYGQPEDDARWIKIDIGEFEVMPDGSVRVVE